MITLDYSLESAEERNELVKKICAEAAPEQLTPRYLEILSDYIIFAMDKQERKSKKEKKVGMYGSGLRYRKGNNVPDRITA